uniref:Uncharacterized protein n=1 Tax=viral metagenome TaxID=1070528 RepID=A0A6M3XVB7_9ZZZZ
MKRLIFILLAVVFLTGQAFAASPTTLKRNVWRALQYFEEGIDMKKSGLTDYVSIPLTSFTQDGAEIPMTASAPELFVSGPEAKIGVVNGNQAIILPAVFTGSIEATIPIPPNYYKNTATGEKGKFKVITDSMENGHAASVDFAVRVHTSSAMDTTDSVESSVALAASPSTRTVAVLTLDPASDDDNFAVDKWVTIKLKRTENAPGGVGRNSYVSIYGFIFEYDKKD